MSKTRKAVYALILLVLVGLLYAKICMRPVKVTKPIVFSHTTISSIQRLLRNPSLLIPSLQASLVETHGGFVIPLTLREDSLVQVRGVLLTINEGNKIALTIEAEWPSTYHIFRYATFYQRALSFKNELDEVASEWATRTDIDSLIYGVEVRHERVKHEFLLTKTAFFSDKPPSFSEIYVMADALRAYITRQGGEIEDSLMLYISEAEHKLIIAYPTNKELKGNKVFKSKKMVRGNILHTEVRGGIKKALQVKQALREYIQDKGLSCPAIEYDVLTSSRRAGYVDSLLCTDLYFPIY